MFAANDNNYMFSSRARTTTGVTGSISGSMSDAAELIYLGDGAYGVLDKVGNPRIR